MGLERLFCTTAETLLAFTFDACRETEKKAVTVGARNDTETVILGNIYKELIESNTDIEVKTSFGLDGISGCFDALKEGRIDMFGGDMEAVFSSFLAEFADQENKGTESGYKSAVSCMMSEHHIDLSKPLGYKFNQTGAACNFVRREVLERYPELKEILGKLEGKISDGAMAEMIHQVDVMGIGAQEAAWRFLKDNKFLGGK